MRILSSLIFISVFLIISCNKLNKEFAKGYKDGADKAKSISFDVHMDYIGEDNYSKGWREGHDETKKYIIIQELRSKIKELEGNNNELQYEIELNKTNEIKVSKITNKLDENSYLISLYLKMIKKYEVN